MEAQDGVNLRLIGRRVVGILIDPIRTSMEIARNSTVQESALSFFLISLGMTLVIGAGSEEPVLSMLVAPIGAIFFFLTNFLVFGALLWIFGKAFGTLLSIKKVYSLIGYPPVPFLLFFSLRPFLIFAGVNQESLAALQALFSIWFLALTITVYNYASRLGWLRSTLVACLSIFAENIILILFGR